MAIDRPEATPPTTNQPGRLSRLFGIVAGAASGVIGGAIGGFRKSWSKGIQAMQGSGSGGSAPASGGLFFLFLLFSAAIIVGPGLVGLAYGAVAGAVNGAVDGACNGLTAGLNAATRINQQEPDDRFLDYYRSIIQRENNQAGSPRYADRLATLVTDTIPNTITTQLNKLAPAPSARNSLLSAPLPKNTGILSRIGYGIKGLFQGIATGLVEGWQHERNGNLISLLDGVVFAPLAAIGGGLYGAIKGFMQGNRGIELAQDKIRDYANYERRLIVNTNTKGIQLTDRFAPGKFENTLLDPATLTTQYPNPQQREEALYYIKQEASRLIKPAIMGTTQFGEYIYGAHTPDCTPLLTQYAKSNGHALTVAAIAPALPSSTSQIARSIAPTPSVMLSPVQAPLPTQLPPSKTTPAAATVIKAVREPVAAKPQPQTLPEPSKYKPRRT